jgi:hypothetical protein
MSILSSSVEFQNQTKIINNVEDHPSNIFIQVGSICFSDFWEKDTNVKSYQMHEDNEKPILNAVTDFIIFLSCFTYLLLRDTFSVKCVSLLSVFVVIVCLDMVTFIKYIGNVTKINMFLILFIIYF